MYTTYDEPPFIQVPWQLSVQYVPQFFVQAVPQPELQRRVQSLQVLYELPMHDIMHPELHVDDSATLELCL